jgi:hypothetical protein
MSFIIRTREERREELKKRAARQNGFDKVYLILTRNFIAFEKLSIGIVMIAAIGPRQPPPWRGQLPAKRKCEIVLRRTARAIRLDLS